ncbi:DUF4292 domain-containing protein [Ascidiimonas sp. W6]|uniref:DUF4292 domain-containing protein n=1 Tax=Ascidiimonas meishanensis TaxID=3128903 RepID=UPI0030EE34E1
MNIPRILIRWYLAAVLLMLFSGCASNKVLTIGSVDKKLSARTIVKNHYSNQLDFKTVRGRIKVDYEEGNASQSFGLSFRMEKDKAIWMSATLSVVKVLITPNRVSFYNKLENNYFDGDFSFISNMLGAELDFEKVQNLLLGQAIFDLKKESFKAAVANNNYELKPTKDFSLFKRLFLLEPRNFKMSIQQISQPEEYRVLNVNYKTYQNVEGKVFPDKIVVTALEENKEVKIALEYRNIQFDERVSFPYTIPKGYKEIALKK